MTGRIARWRTTLREPDWHLALFDDIQTYILPRIDDCPDIRTRWRIYDLVAEMLDASEVFLGNKRSDAVDRELASVVVHHSGTLGDISLQRLSAMGLLRLYAPAFRKRALNGVHAPVSSGFYRDGLQVFYPYHFLIRGDGSVERMLSLGDIAWHAGSWEVNRRSIAVCLAGDFSLSPPTDAAANALRSLCRGYSELEVIGHGDVTGCECPGSFIQHLIRELQQPEAPERTKF